VSEATVHESGNDRRAIVGDELELARLGVISVLYAQGIEVIAETHSGRELASVAAQEQPDLVVVGQPADLSVVERFAACCAFARGPTLSRCSRAARKTRWAAHRARRARASRCDPAAPMS
jgi:DNA-binding NarL/FixJ family response regulator